MNLRTPLLLAAALAAFTFAAGPAGAVMFDFAGYANGIDPSGTNPTGEKGASSFDFYESGIHVKASAGATYLLSGDNGSRYAYLDSTWGDNQAGLGVTKNLTTADQADPSSDDNLSTGEWLMLTFDEQVTITDLWFRNASHGTTFGYDEDFILFVDGGFLNTFGLTNHFAQALTGTSFIFSVDDWSRGAYAADSDQLYISAMDVTAAAPVPEPGTMVLLGSGLLGLAGRVRRRRK